MLSRVISGGQTGADEAGLIAAKLYGLDTGGFMPDGFKTRLGDRPEFKNLYGCIAMPGATYRSRTFANVESADATIRLAEKFNTAGEKCTKNAILKHDKLFYDVNVVFAASFDWDGPDSVINTIHPKHVANWITHNGIETLNVAGNSNRDFWTAASSTKLGERVNIKEFVILYLSRVFEELGLQKVENGV